MDNSKTWSPYVAGIGIGLTLLATFYLFGWGLGASTAFSIPMAVGLNGISESLAHSITYFVDYFNNPSPLKNWILFEVGGVFLGALCGTIFFGRFKWRLDRGKNLSSRNRVLAAYGGGILIGFASRLARGCTSGVVLSGAAQLAVGGWVFAISMFISGFIAAAIFKRLWS